MLNRARIYPAIDRRSRQARCVVAKATLKMPFPAGKEPRRPRVLRPGRTGGMAVVWTVEWQWATIFSCIEMERYRTADCPRFLRSDRK